MPRLPRATPVAARIRVSHLRGNPGVVHRAGALDVRELRAPNVGDRRHALPGYAHVVGDLVPSCLVGRQPEERRQRAGTATSPRPGQLSNRMAVAAQASTCDGPGLAGTVCPGRSRWTKPLSVGLSRVGGAGTSERRHLSSLARRCAAVRLAGSECGAWWASSAESLLPFVQEAVEPGAVVITDGLQSYPWPPPARL